MRAQGCVNATEEERLRAVNLVCRKGWSPVDVAEALGRSPRTIQGWVQKSNRGRKPTALRTKKAPGAEPKLSQVQQRELLRLLEAGPEAAGFAGQLWTGPRVGELIQREFGVTYHVRYLPTLLRSLGWSVQKPKRRASERKDEVIDEWVNTHWPRIKKKPAALAQRSRSSTRPDS